jgi:hypothetical protein
MWPLCYQGGYVRRISLPLRWQTNKTLLVTQEGRSRTGRSSFTCTRACEQERLSSNGCRITTCAVSGSMFVDSPVSASSRHVVPISLYTPIISHFHLVGFPSARTPLADPPSGRRTARGKNHDTTSFADWSPQARQQLDGTPARILPLLYVPNGAPQTRC